MTIEEELLNDAASKEALEWLQSGPPDSRTLGELPTTAASLELVRKVYAVGAKSVTAVKIDTYPEGQNTGKLIITLPAESTARQRVFDWCGRIAEQNGFDPDTDTGQQHLLVMLD